MMLEKASKLDKILDAENISEYINYELTQSGFAAKLRKNVRKCFLLWAGLEPPLQVADFRATLITALALFFCPSLVRVCQSGSEQVVCIQSILPTLS